MNIYTFALIVFAIAFPFGFWRVRTTFRSAQWMLAIHIPVLLIVLIKIKIGIPFSFKSFILNILSFTLAQVLAGIFYKYFIRNKKAE